MKKLFAMILALVLLMGAACAETPVETRMRMLQVNGEFSEVFETVHNEETYSVWYQADLFEAGLYYDHVCFKPVGAAEEDESLFYLIVPIEIVGDEECAAMIAESVGGFEAEWTISEMRELTADAGNKILSIEANNGTEIYRYYLVQGETFSLCITAFYPAEEAEEMSACLDIMTKTFEF